ncbi:MAG: hypothetical protein MUE50_00035 [Pirellulaceae bacterium]|nr:hypothetical protein [Pirellulaceae bacterium]
MGRHSMTAALSAAWHALLCVAKNHANRKDLRDGAHYRVDLRVVGMVGSVEVDEPISGQLSVSGPQEKASSAAVPTAEVVAWLWDQVPQTRRRDLADQAAAYFAEHGELPAVADRDLKDAKLWLKRLRATKTVRAEGAVTFESDPEPDALEAAEAKAA